MIKNNAIEVFRNKKKKYQWRLKWANGEIGASSEVYTTKHGAIKSALKILECLTTNKHWERWHYEVEG